MQLSKIFNALANEAEFTMEMLASGATQIRKANYANKGIYFQALTGLSTGLERIGKLCLIVDFYIESNGKFPDLDYLKNQIGHDIVKLYEKSKNVVKNRKLKLKFLQHLDDDMHQSILRIISDFAKGDRYSNINFLANKNDKPDSMAQWYEKIDKPIFDKVVPKNRREKVRHNSEIVGALLSGYAAVLHSSETGSTITDPTDASFRTGVFKAVSPWRQLYVLQIIRYWVEIIWELQNLSHKSASSEVPFFSEIFSRFFNEDSYLRTRKTWEKL